MDKVYRGDFKNRHYGFDRSPEEEKAFQKLCKDLRVMLKQGPEETAKEEEKPFFTQIERLILDSVGTRFELLSSGKIRNDENLLMVAGHIVKSLERFSKIYSKRMEKNKRINQ